MNQFIPSAPEIDPESARQLFEYAGKLILHKVPVGTDIGIDFSEWKVGPKFGGLKFVPPGLHYFHYCVTPSEPWNNEQPKQDDSTAVDFRRGYFFSATQSQTLVFQWDPESEELVPENELDPDFIGRLKLNIKELDRCLGPYPIDSSANMRAWPQLTDHITNVILDQVMPAKHPGLHYLSSMMESTLAEDTPFHSPRDDPVSNETLHFTRFDLRRSWDPDVHCDPSMVTKYSLDKSWLLLATFCHDSLNTLLGELQLSFVCLLVGHNYDGFDQWKRILHLVCQSREAISSHPELFISFLRPLFYVIYHQLTECPSDFFTDLLSSGNFVFKLLSQLRHTINHPDPDEPARPTRLVNAMKRVGQYCQQKFAISLETYKSEGFSINSDNEIEEGEDAPVVVIL